MKKKVLCKGSKIKYGRKLFNDCLPEDYPLIDEEITKSRLNEILNDIALKYSSDVTLKVLDNIKNLGFSISTKEGFTLSLDDLYNEELEKFIDTLDSTSVLDNIKKINTNKKINNIIKSMDCYNYISSGARGSMDQLRQLVLCRGHIADSNNNIIPEIIRSSLVNGLSEKEFFVSSHGARKGLIDTAENVSKSGFLTRQLVYSNVHQELSDTIDDCGTKDYIELNIFVKDIINNQMDEKKTEQLAKSLVWRYILVGEDLQPYLITTGNYKALIGKKIKLRSPVYCNSKKICKTCYGTLHKILHTNQIGIIAAQAIGERSTQLVLRSFHTSGVVSKSKDNKNDDIVGGISEVNKLFHNPSDLIKLNRPEDLIMRLYEIFSEYGHINLIHYEVLVSSMMFIKDKDIKWRLVKNRNNYPVEYCSILQIPSKTSWLLGVCFSRLKMRLLDGLISNKIDTPNSLNNLFKF